MEGLPRGQVLHLNQNSKRDVIMLSDNKAIFTIGVAAKMLEVHPRTLRIYEQEGLIRPTRKGKWRYFTMDDIKWIECLRSMIHEQGISIAAIKKLLQYTPCWNITDCSFEKRKQCTAFMSSGLVPRKIEIEQPQKIARTDGDVAA
jgi:MerR family transcriptional regulator/heat shock protein HspR